MRRPAHPWLVALLLGVTPLAACGEGATDEGAAAPSPTPEAATPTPPPEPEPAATPTPTPTPEPALTIVATVGPVADLVARVAGERADVEPLIPPGMDSHTYEPRPQDVALMDGADAFFGIGHGLNDGALRLAGENLPEGAPLALLGETHLDPDALISEDAAHGHTHGDGEWHTHGDEDGAPNPHVWMSLHLAMDLVRGAAEELGRLDPGGAEDYEAAADAYLDDLAGLDEAIGEAVATIPDSNRRLVTYHDAWGYFARDYGLDSATAVQPADFSEPSAAEVRELIDLVRAEDVPAVFGSEVFPSDVLDAIAEETGATYVGDLSDDVLPGEPGDPEHSYLEFMRRNASTIVEALGGETTALDDLG